VTAVCKQAERVWLILIKKLDINKGISYKGLKNTTVNDFFKATERLGFGRVAAVSQEQCAPMRT